MIKFFQVILEPWRLVASKKLLAVSKLLPDKIYLKCKFRSDMGYKLNLSLPKTFNEKLQWLKLHDRNPQHSLKVDKYEAKEYVTKIIGSEYIIPTYGVWDRFDDIDFDSLPNQFVMKCTHDSAGLVIVKDKSNLDLALSKKKIEDCQKRNFFYIGREWPYKNVKPRIIIEKYMTNDNSSDEFTDYKFYCFNGYVDCVMVCYDRGAGDTKFYFFDNNWNLKRINKRGKDAPENFTLPKPKCINEMFKLASILSKGEPFVRVDLYESNEKVYFGELTFYPQSGFDANYLPETDRYFGDLIDLDLAFGMKGRLNNENN